MSSSRAQLGEAVRLRQQATGESYNRAQMMLSSSPDPVSVIPAPAPEQQQWEAFLVGLIAPVFARHDAGSLFGIRSVTPLADHLMLRLECANLALWVQAVSGAGRAGTTGPQMLIESAPKGVKLIEESTGAMVVLDRAFPRQRQRATAAAQAPDDTRGGTVDRAVELSRSPYGFEASALLRRARLVSAVGIDGQVHLEVRDESDGRPRLFEVGGEEPRAVLWHALDGAPEALYPAQDGPALPACRRLEP
ncbi:hypothetical protein [Streptomyces californicus]|uniref:hypothetical protein n=1 Tax=Streptomyces californicus TaxID=67351 RepID=UPI00379D6A4D